MAATAGSPCSRGRRASGRAAGGRHAGIQPAKTWDELGKSNPRPLLPVDALYAQDAEIHGLPAFRYGDMYVGFLTRMRCAPQDCTWFGGRLSGELAFSYNGLTWQRLGQQPSSGASGAPPVLGDSPDAVLFPNRPGPTAGQIHATAMQPIRNGSGLRIYAGEQCPAWPRRRLGQGQRIVHPRRHGAVLSHSG